MVYFHTIESLRIRYENYPLCGHQRVFLGLGTPSGTTPIGIGVRCMQIATVFMLKREGHGPLDPLSEAIGKFCACVTHTPLLLRREWW